MIKVMVLIAMALVAGASQAGWESWLKSSIYRGSCESYDYLEPLSNEKDVEGGAWGNIPKDSAWAASARGYWQYIQYLTEDTGISFVPETIGDRPVKSVLISMLLNGCEEYPSVSGTPRGAFALYTPENGDPCFIGWTASGWRELQTDSIIPTSAQWYDISMKFMQRSNGTVRVQYRLKEPTYGTYVTLHATNDENAVWFPAGSGQSEEAIVSKVDFYGDGAFRYVEGSEPRRGMLISLVPWREMLIDESVDRHGTGDWRVFDYYDEVWLKYPAADGDAYVIDVPDGESYTGFLPQKQGEDGLQVVEFAVSFFASNENSATPNDVCALVRVVEDPSAFDVGSVDLRYRFACLVNGGWYTNTTMWADVDADYTVEVSLDKKANAVSYRIRQGRGAEAGAYQPLVPFSVQTPINSPLFTFFGGVGKVYSVKSSEQEVK